VGKANCWQVCWGRVLGRVLGRVIYGAMGRVIGAPVRNKGLEKGANGLSGMVDKALARVAGG
jgi:hypothetical protein